MGAYPEASITIWNNVLGLSICLSMGLFDNIPERINLELPDAEIIYFPSFLSSDLADDYFDRLSKETHWQQDEIKIFGKTYPQPRLTALYGEQGKPYSYSGIRMQPIPFTPLLMELKEKVEAAYKASYTTVLLNQYRDGQDSNGWHSDDEAELGMNPTIASLSLGAERRFHLRHKHEKNLKQSIDLEHGSLLIMTGTTQHYWKHQLAKTARKVTPRINLTYRRIIEQ